MTIESVTDTDIKYFLVAYDKYGEERQDDPDAPQGRLSELLQDELKNQPVTDVFLMSHGWKGDIPAAKDQYNDWIRAMVLCSRDRERIRERRPGFHPLLIGLHWPSLPWGDENLASGATTDSSLIAIRIKDAADKIAATERAQAALRIIFRAALTDIVPPTLPPEVVDAYQVLQGEAGLTAGGLAAAPGSDAEDFDPERSYQQALEEEAISFGLPGLGGLLSPLRQLSFWKMKARARAFGESGAARLLRNLQRIAGEQDIRFHLMGHSFGCIVVSAAVASACGNAALEKPVHSLFLVQGALSLWSYCANIPIAQGRSGYFHSLIRDGRVAGPIVTTHSVHDTAVGRLYPLAAGLKEQVDFAPGVLPKYGALGAYGARGLGIPIEDCKMLPVQDTYHFEAGKLYNLESSRFICAGGGLSGAHNDIAKAEVAHAFWSAVTE